MYVHETKTPNGYLHQVYLDGKILVGCIEADEDGGWARCYEMAVPPSGSHPLIAGRLIMAENGMPIEVMKYGQIEIRPL